MLKQQAIHHKYVRKTRAGRWARLHRFLYFFFFPCLFLWIGTKAPRAQLAGEQETSSAFHHARREALRQMMPKRSVAVFFSSPVRNRSADVDYVYHPDRHLFYLTGYEEPHALLLLFKTAQRDPLSGEEVGALLFVRLRQGRDTLYRGPSTRPEVLTKDLGLQVYEASLFEKEAFSLDNFEQVLFFPLAKDLRDTPAKDDLYDLQALFRQKAHYPLDYDASLYEVYEEVSNPRFLGRKDALQQLYTLLEKHPSLRHSTLWTKLVEEKEPSERLERADEIRTSYLRLNTKDLTPYLTKLREYKTAEEIAWLRRAIKISCVAQVELMRTLRPGMSELEIQGIHEFIYRKYGVAHEGYPSIVGGGHNGCVLHYIKNDQPTLRADQLVLMDLGAAYHGYTADITRTIPVGGRFSSAQRLIYEVVLQAQDSIFSLCRPGTTFNQLNQEAIAQIAQGLTSLGIIDKNLDKTARLDKARRYLPHGITHHIGLDVHDPGMYAELGAGMVITIEPGVYIPKNSPCDKKWWGIAVRIEDDLLITEAGYELLSASVPREVEAIEAVMAEKKSPLYDYHLPPLDSFPTKRERKTKGE